MSSGLTSDLVLYYMSKGRRQVDIAEEFGVSRQYVHNLAKRGGYESPITTVTENMPWEVDSDHYRHPIYMAMRLVGHLALAPDNLTIESVERAEGLINRLRTFDVVVDYNPVYPPMPGVTGHTGFAYLPRTSEDEDFIMKVRPGVRITPLGSEIWRMPDEEYFDFARGGAR